jgi:L-histidine Nalpha-methyltransferase
MVARTAVDLLRSMRATLGQGSLLLIGMDLVKDVAVLEAAYDDAAGVTAEFNLNLARRINRELGGTIPVENLRHVARWNDTFARIEMHLEALDDIAFEVSGRRFAMAKGETIHTENSHKFDLRSQNTLLLAGGWTPVRRWTDSQERFSLILAEWTVPRGAP